MSVCDETYEAIEADLLAAADAGRVVKGLILTSELYRQLDYGGDHFTESARAIYYGEPAKELYQLPVTLELGAHHAWRLI